MRNLVGCARTCSYSSSGTSIRCVQFASPHSQRNSASFDSKRSDASAMPSLTARKKAALPRASALAHDLRLVLLEALGRLRDAFVDGTEERLVASVVRPGGHSELERRSPANGCAGTLPAVATKQWPEAVERVSSYLREARAEVRIEEFPEGTPTAKDAARAAGCELGQIVKSLVFDCDGRSVVALIPGDRRADSDQIARPPAGPC